MLVVADEVQFSLRTSLLTRSSTFFRTSCKPRWFERSHIIRLPDEIAEYSIHVCWLYTSKFVPAQHVKDDPNGTTTSNEQAELLHRPVNAFPTDVGNGKAVARLYILGTSLLDQKLCNAVMDALYHSYPVIPTDCLHEHQVTLANFAYDCLPRRCGLCRFLCDQIAHHSSERLKLLREKMRRGLLEDVALRLGLCEYRYKVQYQNTRAGDYYD